MIYVIKLNTSEVVLGELLYDDTESLSIRDALKLNTVVRDNTDGSYYVANQPVLFFPYGSSDAVDIKKRDILYYDLASDYYSMFHQACYTGLAQQELNKQEMVKKIYAGEDESAQYNKEQEQNFTDEAELDIIQNQEKPTFH